MKKTKQREHINKKVLYSKVYIFSFCVFILITNNNRWEYVITLILSAIMTFS